MKVIVSNDGILTNFEVLDLLQSRGAANDPARVLAPVAPSEYKVYDYLVKSVSCNQTRDVIHTFVERCKKYNLTPAEIVSIVNTRPSTSAKLYPIIEQCDERLGEDNEQLEELVKMISEVLPPPPVQEPQPTEEEGMDVEEDVEEDVEAALDGEQMDGC